MTSRSIIHVNLYKPNNKLISAKLEHFWCTDEPRANTDSQDSPRLELGGSHHLAPYIYLVFGHETNTEMSFCPRTPEIPKIPKIVTPAILKAHNFVCKPLIEVRSKAKS